MIEQKTIGIIGIHGGFGQACRRLCECMGHTVIGSDLTTTLTNEEVVKQSDVVIFCVLPLSAATAAIEEVLPYSSPAQLWMDVGSLKVPMVNAMTRSRAEVLGMHPLFAPPKGATWEGGAIAVHHARIDTWARWTHAFLEATGARTIEIDPALHDFTMLGPQNETHLSVLARGMAIRALGLEPTALVDLSTRPSRAMSELLHRMLQQPSDVYADIQFDNPQSLKAVDALLMALGKLRGIIQRKDRDAFANIFAELEAYYGDTLVPPSGQ